MEKYKDIKIPIKERVSDLISKMTLEEKVAQLGTYLYSQLVKTPEGEVRIRDLELSDEIMDKLFKNGVGQIAIITSSNKDPIDAAKTANKIQRSVIKNSRLQIPTIFDAEAAVGLIARDSTHNAMPFVQASTFDPELITDMMNLAREQMMAVGVREVFAPVVDVARDPRWGRTEETFGEDVYLVSTMSNAFIKGVQGTSFDKGVASTPKHFLAYGMSESGMNMGSTNIGERTLLENVAPPFEIAVKLSKVGGIMSSYNDVDGEPVTGSNKYCRKLLRDDWGFDGILVQDAGAMPRLHSEQRITDDMQEAGIMSIKSGIDLELMSDCCFGENIIDAVKKGLVDEKYIDESCARNLELKFKLGLFDNPYVDEQSYKKSFRTIEREKNAREVVREGTILLKNKNNILPLPKSGKKLAIIGPQGDCLRGLFTNYSHIAIQDVFKVIAHDPLFASAVDEYPIKGATLLDGIKSKVDNNQITYVEGCKMDTTCVDEIAKAVEAARNSDIVILAVGSVSGFLTSHNCGEARDSATLRLPGAQEELVKRVIETGKPIILVTIGGRVFGIGDIIDKVDAMVTAFAPGEEGGNGIADVLFGDYNPAGRLPMTMPYSVGQVPIYYNHKCGGGKSMPHGNYTDMSSKPIFSFGHGLSYTTFEYSDLKITNDKINAGDDVVISTKIKNSGNFDGDEVVQLYICDEYASISRPNKELKGFKRVHINKGETKSVEFTMNINQMAFYNRDMDYVIEPGNFKVMIGASSEDIRLEGNFSLEGKVTKIASEDKVFFTKAIVK